MVSRRCVSSGACLRWTRACKCQLFLNLNRPGRQVSVDRYITFIAASPNPPPSFPNIVECFHDTTESQFPGTPAFTASTRTDRPVFTHTTPGATAVQCLLCKHSHTSSSCQHQTVSILWCPVAAGDSPPHTFPNAMNVGSSGSRRFARAHDRDAHPSAGTIRFLYDAFPSCCPPRRHSPTQAPILASAPRTTVPAPAPLIAVIVRRVACMIMTSTVADFAHRLPDVPAILRGCNVLCAPVADGSHPLRDPCVRYLIGAVQPDNEAQVRGSRCPAVALLLCILCIAGASPVYRWCGMVRCGGCAHQDLPALNKHRFLLRAVRCACSGSSPCRAFRWT